MSGAILGALSDDDTRGTKHELGRAGEELAARYLERKGLAVLARNWRCRLGELDIVATDSRTVVFCEVKTRSGVDYGAPLDAVSPHKVRRVRELAMAWLCEYQLEGCPARFDVISIVWPPGHPARIEHLAEAF